MSVLSNSRFRFYTVNQFSLAAIKLSVLRFWMLDTNNVGFLANIGYYYIHRN